MPRPSYSSSLGKAEPALVEAGRDHDGAGGVAFAVGGLDRPRTIAGELGHFAEADFHAGDDGVVGHERGHLRAAEDLVEIVQFAEIDQHAAWRELVEAQALQAGARSFGRGGEAGGAGADDDDVVGGCIHGVTLYP